MFARVEDVVLEGSVGGQRLCGRPGLNRAGGLSSGVFVERAAGSGSDEPDQGGHGGVSDVADRVQSRRVRSLAAVAGPPP